MKSSPLFSNISTGESTFERGESASYFGVSIKSIFLIGISVIIALAIAFYLPKIIETNHLTSFLGVIIGASIVGLLSVIIGRTNERLAKYFAVIYAACQGLLLGTITLVAELYYPGVGIIAIAGTFTIFIVMLAVYSFKIIRVTTRFRKMMMAMTLGIFGFFIIYFIGSLFVTFSMPPYLYLIISAVLLLYGTFSLLINFDEAVSIVDRGCSKDAEWSVAFGLIITLIYIYIQILRLALYLSRRD